MTIESTLTSTPTKYGPDRWARVTLADQRRAFAALDRITALHPHLPAAYIVLSYVHPDEIEVQAQSWPALEAWREALNVLPADVDFGNCEPEREHLEFSTTVDGIRVRVYMIGDLVTSAVAEDSAVAA